MKHYRNAMPRNRFLIAMIFVLILSLAAAGCGRQEAGRPASLDDQADTITVTDCIGRQVKIPAHIERIACLCPESGHALAMFGLGEKIVATVGGIQRDVLLTEMYPNIKGSPVPKTSGVINIEELANSKPDLVFVKGDTARNEAEVEKMNKSKLPFLVIEFNSMKEQQDAIAMIGKAVGASEKAEKYNEFYRNCVELVSKRVAGIPVKDRIRIYHSVNEATRTDTKGTLPADWTQAAGAVNVSVNEDLKLLEDKYYASLEQILLWNPDVILVNEPGVTDYIINHEQWAPLKAVKNRKVLPMPNGVTRWGHFSSLETPLAVLWTAKTLYPEQFTDVDMVAETKYFYKEFFNFELTDELARKVLSGVGMRESK